MCGLDGVIVKGFCLKSYLGQKRNEKEEWGNRVRFAWDWGVAAFNPQLLYDEITNCPIQVGELLLVNINYQVNNCATKEFSLCAFKV